MSIGPVAVIHPKVLPPQMIYQPQALDYANTTFVPDAPSVSNDAVMYPTKMPLEHNTIAMDHVFEKGCAINLHIYLSKFYFFK